jgi:hypothetical protein
MTLEIIDSRYGNYKKNLPDILQIILAKENSLTISEISKRLREEFFVRVTFQAVRKSLNILVDRKILEVADKRYSLDKNYILELKRLTDQLLKNYFSGSKPGKINAWTKNQQQHATYTFENFIKTDQFCNEIILDWAYNLKEGDNCTFCFQSPHYWYIFGQLVLESNFLSEIKKLKVDAYYIADGKTILDKWTKRFYDEHRINFAINASKKITNTTMSVFGDLVVQYDYPQDLYDAIEEFYVSTVSLENLDLSRLANLLKFNTEIKMTVIRNKMIAQKLKEELLSQFKKSKTLP